MYTYTYRGQTHTMSREEAMLIKASGTSSYERYARIAELNKPDPPVMDTINAMEDRPGKVDEGVRPLDKPQPPRLHPPSHVKPHDPEAWHLLLRDSKASHDTACGKRSGRSEVFGFVRFTRLHDHPKTCPKCWAVWYKEFNSDNPRKATRSGYRS